MSKRSGRMVTRLSGLLGALRAIISHIGPHLRVDGQTVMSRMRRPSVDRFLTLHIPRLCTKYMAFVYIGLLHALKAGDPAGQRRHGSRWAFLVGGLW